MSIDAMLVGAHRGEAVGWRAVAWKKTPADVAAAFLKATKKTAKR
jgi:hypothetical protein